MKPVLFNIFNIKIYGYGTMIAIGILCAYLLFIYRTKNIDYNQDKLFNMTCIAVISGIAGAKLLYLLVNFKELTDNFSWKALIPGYVVYGGIIGGVLAVYLYSKSKKWDSKKIFDLAIPCVALAQGFGRIGCLLAGCCYGKPTNSFIGIIFNNSYIAPIGVKLVPTEIISSLFDFVLAFFLIWYTKKNKKDGMIFALYVIIYSIGRFIIEFFRGDTERGFVGVLSTAQFISIFIMLTGIFMVFHFNKLSRQKSEE